VENEKSFQSGEKYKDFSKWSCCDGRPAQMKNTKIFQSGEKYKDFSKWSSCDGRPAQVKNTKIFQSCRTRHRG
jgi:elongation factor P hydroxylase